jgi:hypothetical protein
MVVEWVLVTIVAVLPFALMVPVALQMLRVYFYRIAGVLCLPFP